MDTSAVDFPALLVACGAAVLITAVLAFASRGDDRRRVWIAAGLLSGVLILLGAADLLREVPRETHIATAIVAGTLPVLGAVGILRPSRRLLPWLRWPLVFVIALVLLFVGLLVGGTVAPRFLP